MKECSLLDEPTVWAVLLYNATTAVRSSGWSGGSQDADFPRLVRRTVRRVGRLLPDTTAPVVLELLRQLSADRSGRYLSAEVAESIRRRMRGGRRRARGTCARWNAISTATLAPVGRSARSWRIKR